MDHLPNELILEIASYLRGRIRLRLSLASTHLLDVLQCRTMEEALKYDDPLSFWTFLRFNHKLHRIAIFNDARFCVEWAYSGDQIDIARFWESGDKLLEYSIRAGKDSFGWMCSFLNSENILLKSMCDLSRERCIAAAYLSRDERLINNAENIVLMSSSGGGLNKVLKAAIKTQNIELMEYCWDYDDDRECTKLYWSFDLRDDFKRELEEVGYPVDVIKHVIRFCVTPSSKGELDDILANSFGKMALNAVYRCAIKAGNAQIAAALFGVCHNENVALDALKAVRCGSWNIVRNLLARYYPTHGLIDPQIIYRGPKLPPDDLVERFIRPRNRRDPNAILEQLTARGRILGNRKPQV